jgi:RNA polymerase sigma-70 factor (ECF subfamily)
MTQAQISGISMKVNLESIVPDLRKFIRYYVPDAQDAEDILQDTLLKIHLKNSSLKESEKFRNWSFTVARNTVLTHFQKQKRDKKLVLAEFFENEGTEENYNECLFDCIEQLVSDLDEPYKEALSWVYSQGNSQVSLAERKGVSISTVKSRVQRGRDLVKKQLNYYCHLEFDCYGNLVNYKSKNCYP